MSHRPFRAPVGHGAEPRMTIALDVGNGSVKLARVRDGRVSAVERIPSRPAPAPALLAERIAALRAQDPDGIVALVSVVPTLTEVVRQAVRDLGAELRVVEAASLPLAVRLAHPDRVGADRLTAAWGAREAHGSPVIVADLGTATTVDAVDADGAFVGGAILPGLGLGLAALVRGTALLPEIELEPPPTAIGRDTIAAIRSGVVLGHVGAIRELVGRIGRELAPDGPRPVVVATGGFTALGWVRELLLAADGSGAPIADAVDADLMLRALDRLATLQAAPAA
jgi:type III pantothenate kinase